DPAGVVVWAKPMLDSAMISKSLRFIQVLLCRPMGLASMPFSQSNWHFPLLWGLALHWRLVRFLQAALGCSLGVRRRIAGVERRVVVHQSGLAVLLKIIDASEIDVRPGQDARLTSDLQGPLEVGARAVHIFIERGAPRQDKECPARIVV